MNKMQSILARYLILLAIAIPNLYLFYLIFTFLTLYPVYFLLKLFYSTSLSGNTIIVGNFSIELINACIAGSAYYLLLVLNLTTPSIKLKKRVKLIVLSFFAFLILNIIRIFFLSLLLFSGSNFFEITHQIFWYIISTIFVVVIWFAGIKIFKIREVPIYSDVKHLLKLTKQSNKS